MGTLSDKEIVALFWARSEEALIRTKEKFGARLLALANRILGNRGDAEECENDTYLDAWNSIPPHAPDPMAPYLFTVCRNNALSRVRAADARKRGKGACAAVYEEMEEFTPDPSFEEPADIIVLRDAMNAFLAALSERDRKIFLRRYYYMSSIAEISSEFGLGQSNVKAILSRTRVKLREHLACAGFSV